VALRGVNDDEIHDMVAWCGERGFDLTFIEVMPMGDIGGEDRLDQYYSLRELRRDLERRWTLDRHARAHRRAGPLRPRRRDRRPRRLHHAAHPQFLRAATASA
jgi:GTP 3',8-cyclase